MVWDFSFTEMHNLESSEIKCDAFKLGQLHEKHAVATWVVGNRLSICVKAG